MSATRRLASRLLRFVIRHSPSDSQDWGNAMLRELDFIESDWAALLWALGSTTAIFTHCARALRARLGKQDRQKERPMANSNGKRAAGIAAGIAIAAVLVVSALSVVHLLFHFVPAWDLRPMPWLMAAVVILEAIFVFAAVTLWRKRRPMAVGILLSAVLVVTHVIIHLATHGMSR
jgi:cytochrome bd-type quinol oxidase subunit 2